MRSKSKWQRLMEWLYPSEWLWREFRWMAMWMCFMLGTVVGVMIVVLFSEGVR
jgi:uncharacterized membrane protein YoaK (UPF0700 family)